MNDSTNCRNAPLDHGASDVENPQKFTKLLGLTHPTVNLIMTLA